MKMCEEAKINFKSNIEREEILIFGKLIWVFIRRNRKYPVCFIKDFSTKFFLLST